MTPDVWWSLAVSEALLESADETLEPGTSVGDVINKIGQRAKEIYAMKKPKGKGKKC